MHEDSFKAEGFSVEAAVRDVVVGWSVSHHLINTGLRFVRVDNGLLRLVDLLSLTLWTVLLPRTLLLLSRLVS